MSKQKREKTQTNETLIKLPAYPFSARQLFGELRARLAEEHRCPMTYDRLAIMLGKARSTIHNWFEIYGQPQVLGFMCLMERLSPAERDDFIASHCRTLPTLGHPRLTHSPATIGKLLELLNQKTGVTIITGYSHTFVFTALGHAAGRADEKHPGAAGIDLHRPSDIVPVEGLNYIDGSLGPDHVRKSTVKIWPRILTSKTPRIFVNGVWSCVPEVRDDLLRAARHKHVILADAGEPDFAYLRKMGSKPIHVLKLSMAKNVSEGISIKWRRIKPQKPNKIVVS